MKRPAIAGLFDFVAHRLAQLFVAADVPLQGVQLGGKA